MTRIFTVVPDDRVSRQIATSLQLEGFLVDSAITARDALYSVTGGGYELVIVEYSIADIDGPTLVSAMRATGVSVPILGVDADGNVERCVRMLKSGADDYQSSPLDFEELGARVQGLLRRRTRAQPSGIAGAVAQLQAASITLDRIRRTVIVDSKPVMLRPTEFRLLEFLMLNQNCVMTRRIILETVWQRKFNSVTNVIEVHIKELRKKIEDPAGTRFIRTVRGAGYCFSGDASLVHDFSPPIRPRVGWR
jgi:two-component system OmpR family response regulator